MVMTGCLSLLSVSAESRSRQVSFNPHHRKSTVTAPCDVIGVRGLEGNLPLPPSTPTLFPGSSSLPNIALETLDIIQSPTTTTR